MYVKRRGAAAADTAGIEHIAGETRRTYQGRLQAFARGDVI